MTDRAIVTCYPTRMFGLSYNGEKFHKLTNSETEMRKELELLGIPENRVKWEERYYDRRFDFNDPRSYRKRKFIPQNEPR